MKRINREENNKIDEKNNLFSDKEKRLALERNKLARVRIHLAVMGPILAFVVFIVVMFKMMKIW